MPLDLSTLQTYEVPPGSRPKECNGDTCSARVYWVRPTGSKSPVPVRCDASVVYRGEPSDLSGLGVRHPTNAEHGRGINHFVDCPDSSRFKGGAGDKPASAPRRTVDAERPPAPTISPNQPLTEAARAEPAAEIAGEIPAKLPTPLEPAIARQREKAIAAGARCTTPACRDFAVIGILLHARLFAAPCVDHADDVIGAIFKSGQHSLVTEPVGKYLDDVNLREKFVAKVAQIREHNEALAGNAAPQPQSHGERRTGGVDDGRARR